MSFSLPLSSDEMRVALQRGLGRALLQARAFGVKRDRELVLATCLRNPAHDPQCEVDRAHWMVEFLDKELADEFLSRMGRTEGVSQAYYQSRLAFLLAKRGQPGAKEALYAQFSPVDYGADLIGAKEVLELDGATGMRNLLRRLRDFGGLERIADWIEMLEYYFEAEHGKGSASTLIQDEFPQLTQFVQEVDLDGTGSAQRVVPATASVLRCIDGGGSCGIELGYLGTLVDAGVASEVFERFRRPLTAAQLARLLNFFARTGFPDLDKHLVGYADHPSSTVRWWAVQALSNHEDSRVRELGLRCLRKRRWRASEVSLLHKNYLPGDEVLLRALLHQEGHRLISDLRYLCEAHPRSELLEAMMFVYEASTCLNCRGAVIEVMRELKIFPDWAAEEHRYDALTFSSWN